MSTGQQRAFVEYYCSNGFNATKAAQDAKYGQKNGKTPSNSYLRMQGSRLIANDNIKKAIDEKMKDIGDTAEITREKQLKDLEKVKTNKVLANNPAAYVSACREQNSMLGFHRELGLNPEKEAIKAARMTKEQRKISEKLAKERTDEESREGHIKPDFGQKAG